jgi:hypothetical protein
MPPKKTKPSSRASSPVPTREPAKKDEEHNKDKPKPAKPRTVKAKNPEEVPPVPHSQMKIPLLIDSLTPEQLESYRLRIRKELPDYSTDDPKYEIIYKIRDDKPADYTRAIQEQEILKTRLKLTDHKTGDTKTLRSFTEIWEDSKSGLAEDALAAKDPNEAKWSLTRKYNYKMATTFMPMYAKSIYEYFGAKSCLDPCMGWGDRMCGALASTCVKRYVGFDPNVNLVEGYKKIQQDFKNLTFLLGMVITKELTSGQN